MDWVTLTLQVLKAGISIWANADARKYLDEVIELEKKIQDERVKPPFAQGMKDGNFRNDAIIDHSERRLRIIANAFTSTVGRESISKDLPK